MSEPGRTSYEFGPDQNELIGTLASKMRFVGMFLIALGVVALLGAAAQFRDLRDGNLIVFGLFQIVIGAWTRSAGGGFHRIVTTQGADIPHLMAALQDLRKLYTLQYWLVVLAIVLLVVSLAAAEILRRGQAI
jgi:hypothetical protein